MGEDNADRGHIWDDVNGRTTSGPYSELSMREENADKDAYLE